VQEISFLSFPLQQELAPQSRCQFFYRWLMKVRWLLSLLTSLPLYAWQGTTPQAALEEIASTSKPEVLVQHLPEPVQKRIEALPVAKKQEILKKLLELKSEQLKDCTVRAAQNGDGWEVIDEDGTVKARVKLENAFISGIDAILPLKIESDDATQSFIVKMHLEDHEWRIDDFGHWEKMDLGITDLLHEPTEMEKNEAAAREALGRIEGALRRYAGTNPQIGYPSSLKVLTIGPANLKPEVWRYLGILDDSFAAEPLIKSGYRFRYLLTQSGDGLQDPGNFEIVAVPVEFGVTGQKSFYLDQNGTVHVTTENRPATEDDEAIDDSGKTMHLITVD
jgi:hypothetical protein